MKKPRAAKKPNVLLNHNELMELFCVNVRSLRHHHMKFVAQGNEVEARTACRLCRDTIGILIRLNRAISKERARLKIPDWSKLDELLGIKKPVI